MKIIDRTNARLTFRDLAVGDVFRDEEGDTLMKVSSHGKDKAIGFETCRLYELEDNYPVVKVLQATLTIED